jgi:HB1, ASXL, restriction endonuclease HTH domain
MGTRGVQGKMSVESEGIDHYAVVLADLRARRTQIDQAIQAIESIRGLGSGGGAPPPAAAHPQPQNEAGAYLGMTIAEATRKLLASKKRAMGTSDILAALTAGGLALTSADPINTVSAVLGRRFDKTGDIVRVERGTWGLREWYPNRSFRRDAKVENGEIKSSTSEPVSPSEPTPDAVPE